MSSSYPGRAKTVVIIQEGGQPRGIVTAVVVCSKPTDGSPSRLTFTGSVQIEPATKRHIEEVVLPLVDQILGEGLRIPKLSYDVSFANLAAAGVCDLALCVSGFSADLPVFTAFLSASLGIPIPESLASTGQINSLDGNIGLVSRLPEKIAAAQSDPALNVLVLPLPDGDNSLETLAPKEKVRLETAMATPRENLRLQSVRDIAQALETVFFDGESIVQASFRHGFFDMAPPQKHTIHIAARCAGILTDDNEKRFWNALEHRLLSGEILAAKHLLLERVQYHLNKKAYPSHFGRQLYELVASLPPVIRRLKSLLPILPTRERVLMSQLVSEADYEDAEYFRDAARGTGLFPRGHHNTDPTADSSSLGEASESMDRNLDAILSEISEETLSERFGQPIHMARMSFRLNSITAESHDDFFETMAAFVRHLYRHCNFTVCPVDDHQARIEAVALLEKTFAHQGGAVAAERESRYGFHGGWRLILDAVTERFRAEVYEKHINMVLKSALDPLDSAQKSLLIDALMKRLAPGLPPDILAMPREQLGDKYDGLVRTHGKAMDAIRELFRRV
ncbi:hypothetical protein FJY63_02685 [Candidatus Sumerlaeota bacterium]|nr:hypothetical protein [Candidatus Sumerlaeota bacterium]